MKGSDDCSLFAWDPESLTAQRSPTHDGVLAAHPRQSLSHASKRRPLPGFHFPRSPYSMTNKKTGYEKTINGIYLEPEVP